MRAAVRYLDRGWVPVLVAPRAKRPVRQEWQRHRPTREECESWAEADNVGVLLGDPSQLVDVDLDCPEAVRLAPRLLPPTPARFGRASSPASHYLYRVEEPGGTVRRQLAGETLVEYRGTGGQTVLPPSVHPSGEQIRWEPDAAEPVVGTREALLTATGRLGVAVTLVRSGLSDERAVELALRAAPTEEARALPPEVQRWAGWEATPSSPRGNRPPTPSPHAPIEDLGPAVARWNAAHPLELSSSAGVCPACGGRAWKRQGSTDRWVCYHASHEAPGVRGEGCYHGDALDLEAHREGITIAEVLRRDGYLAERQPARRPLGEQRHPEEEPPMVAGDGLPEVEVSAGSLDRNTGQAIAALAAHGDVYVGLGGLVDVVDHPRHGLRLHALDLDGLRRHLTRAATWWRWRPGTEGPVRSQCDPPADRARAVLSEGQWAGIRPLRGIVASPTLRPDGTVLESPGYDHSLQVIYRPALDYPRMPAQVSLADAQRAADRLLWLIGDFPLASDGDRTAWLALVLTLVGRHAVAGPCPGWLIGASAAGAGKSLLARVALLIASGNEPALKTDPGDDAEVRKYITSQLMSGAPAAIIDNVEGRVGWASLDAALTASRWSDRVLGESRIVECDADTVWIVTSNNAEIAADTERRLLSCHLAPQVERPADHGGHTVPDLDRYVLSHRRTLVLDALSVLVGYVQAGRPSQGLSHWGSYEPWSALVRNAVVWLGLEDPLASRGRLRESDTRAGVLGRLLATLAVSMGGTPWHTGDLLRSATGLGGEALREVLEELCHPRPVGVAEVGRRLARHRDQWSGGLVLRRRLGRTKAWTWWVERAVQGTAGDVQGIGTQIPCSGSEP